jgi:hypothetical protein
MKIYLFSLARSLTSNGFVKIVAKDELIPPNKTFSISYGLVGEKIYNDELYFIT